MAVAIAWGVAIALVLAGLFAWRRSAQREAFIENYRFPARVSAAVQKAYPHLTPSQVQRVMRGLRDYFQVCRVAGSRRVAMPSQAVDVAWHEFILFTRAYQQFCQQALGRFLHHTPAEAMPSPQAATDGIRRAWRIACARARINPRQPLALPLLFALDAELAIADGFRYVPDCGGAVAAAGGAYCGADIGCASGCSGDGGGDSGDGGGGDGGGGCGGD